VVEKRKNPSGKRRFLKNPEGNIKRRSMKKVNALSQR
jgi:hypothetical protein